LIINK